MFNPVTARLSSSTLRNFFLTYRVQIMVALLAVCALILMTQASAAGSNPFDTAFQAQGQKGCGWISSFVSSVLVRIVFFGMAIAGFVMGLARARGEAEAPAFAIRHLTGNLAGRGALGKLDGGAVFRPRPRGEKTHEQGCSHAKHPEPPPSCRIECASDLLIGDTLWAPPRRSVRGLRSAVRRTPHYRMKSAAV